MQVERWVKYLWFVLVMKLTWIFPDWRPVMWLRGFLTKFCYKYCGKNFQIASNVTINCTNQLMIGDNVYLAQGCWLNAQGDITIESEVMLGPYTVISTGDHTLKNNSYRYGEIKKSSVLIGFGSWTGAGTIITSGVKVGGGSCCAAGSVVTVDVPQNSVVGGVPARILGKTVELENITNDS